MIRPNSRSNRIRYTYIIPNLRTAPNPPPSVVVKVCNITITINQEQLHYFGIDFNRRADTVKRQRNVHLRRSMRTSVTVAEQTYHVYGELPIFVHTICSKNPSKFFPPFERQVVAIVVNFLFTTNPAPKFERYKASVPLEDEQGG